MTDRFNSCDNWAIFGGIWMTPIRSRTKAGDGISVMVGGERIGLGPWMTALVPQMTKNRPKGAPGGVKSARKGPWHHGDSHKCCKRSRPAAAAGPGGQSHVGEAEVAAIRPRLAATTMVSGSG
jgi:hypothetical protein